MGLRIDIWIHPDGYCGLCFQTSRNLVDTDRARVRSTLKQRSLPQRKRDFLLGLADARKGIRLCTPSRFEHRKSSPPETMSNAAPSLFSRLRIAMFEDAFTA